MNESTDDENLDVLIHTSITDPVAIGLAESLLQEAGIPFFVMDQNVSARQESGNFLGIWNIRVPRAFEVDCSWLVCGHQRFQMVPFGCL